MINDSVDKAGDSAAEKFRQNLERLTVDLQDRFKQGNIDVFNRIYGVEDKMKHIFTSFAATLVVAELVNLAVAAALVYAFFFR